jgi:hypothetical protein
MDRQLLPDRLICGVVYDRLLGNLYIYIHIHTGVQLKSGPLTNP